MISAGPIEVGMTPSLPAVQVLHRQAHVLELVAQGPQRVANGGNLDQGAPERVGPPGDASGHQGDDGGPDGDDSGREQPRRIEQRHVQQDRIQPRRAHAARLAVDHAREAREPAVVLEQLVEVEQVVMGDRVACGAGLEHLRGQVPDRHPHA